MHIFTVDGTSFPSDDDMSPDIDIGVGDIGVGRYGLRTFEPKIVRNGAYLTSVSQEPIPNINPRVWVPAKYRELMVGTHPVAWEDGTCKAVCQRNLQPAHTSWDGDVVAADEPHEAPDEKCRCGIYALDDLADLYNQYRRPTGLLVAVVSASGITYEHQKGIRTQSARVVAYWLLGHVHGCDCQLCRGIPSPFRYPKPRFPYEECCEAQFPDAVRFNEPEEMAEHFGLKASPLPNRRATFTDMLGKRSQQLFPIPMPGPLGVPFSHEYRMVGGQLA